MPQIHHLRYSVASLLAIMVAVSVILASLRFGVLGVGCLGVPIALISAAALARPADFARAIRINAFHALLGALASWAAVGFVMAMYGQPLGGSAWCFIIGTCAWSIAVATVVPNGARAKAHFAPAVVVFAMLLVGPTDVRFDVAGGRQAVRLAGTLLLEDHDSNSALVRQYLGEREPAWVTRRYSRARSDSILVAPSGLLFAEQLDGVLTMLPDDEARRRVLLCVADGKNFARLHQEAVLVAIHAWGYPSGHDSRSWWDAYGGYFVPIDDPAFAARRVVCWRREIEEARARLGHHGGSLLTEVDVKLIDCAKVEAGLSEFPELFSRECDRLADRKDCEFIGFFLPRSRD